MKDPNRLRTIGPNLGDYTQWVRLRAPTGRKVSRLEEGQKEKQNIKIRTNCEQSARISGTTPSGCACAHPPEAKSPDWRRARRRNKIKKIRTDCEQSARISGTTPSGCACAHPPEAKSPDWRRVEVF